jgi:3-oxo-5-alpha-steroid 4-dehydrogenase 3 / polyprenol reductase
MMSAAHAYIYIFDRVRDFVAGLSPAVICQLFYVFGAVTVLAIAAMPDSVRRLLAEYGARTSAGNASSISAASSRSNSDESGREIDGTVTGLLVSLIASITSASKVPHSWFIHFYILSLSCTIFWAVQFATNGSIVGSIVRSQSSKTTTSMTLEQVVLVWLLMGLQGARRLYEYLAVLGPSSSRMWVIHWLLGNSFYLCTSVAVWVDGSSKLQTVRGVSHLLLTRA